MAENAKPIILNIGCGADRIGGMLGIDLYGAPDMRWDLNNVPWPFSDNSVDGILAKHVFEHLENWWGAFVECSRILKPGGELEIRVPDASSDNALGFRDHVNYFTLNSFYGVVGYKHGTNAWAAEQRDTIPFVLAGFHRVPFKKYERLPHWLLGFLAKHMRNFIWEQRFIFRKTSPATRPAEKIPGVQYGTNP